MEYRLLNLGLTNYMKCEVKFGLACVLLSGFESLIAILEGSLQVAALDQKWPQKQSQRMYFQRFS